MDQGWVAERSRYENFGLRLTCSFLSSQSAIDSSAQAMHVNRYPLLEEKSNNIIKLSTFLKNWRKNE